jgi:two-component system, cell cycle sensor histidine kinase and response regulator CckA
LDYSSGTETILLVEDEELLRHVLAEMLGDLGYRVLSARDGQQALEMSKKHAATFDMLITDVLMPDLDGMKLAVSLRSMRPDIKVLFISGGEDDSTELPPGMARLQKPFTIKMLSQKVRQLLDPEAAA